MPQNLAQLTEKAKEILSGPSLTEWQRTAPVLYERGLLDGLSLLSLMQYCSRFAHRAYFENELAVTTDSKVIIELQDLIQDAKRELEDICNYFLIPFDNFGTMVLDEKVTSFTKKLPPTVNKKESSNLTPLVPTPRHCELEGEALIEWNRVAAKLNSQQSLEENHRRVMLAIYCGQAALWKGFELDIAKSVKNGADKAAVLQAYKSAQHTTKRELKRYARLLNATHDKTGFITI